ncbi:hypothetical protein PIB30_059237 [Stylosanthes scabra]|uniref:Uncharacterized protein n=1 Tax=Stylosanthes scabra TaxID=79078 RepID=A0ABU6TMD3_9FABA|nr:hypothetical protein [Stylosanthes scabra]
MGMKKLAGARNVLEKGVRWKIGRENLLAPNSKHRTFTFILTLWKLWLARNLFIFEGKTLIPEETLAQAGSLTSEIEHQLNLPISSS